MVKVETIRDRGEGVGGGGGFTLSKFRLERPFAEPPVSA